MTTTSHTDAPSSTDAPDATAVAKAPRYWRSLAELNGDESFTNDFLHREFPVAASEFPEGVSRRRWMQLMSASLAMAGVAGCRYPEELIAPFVVRPEGRIPGETYFSATNVEIAGEVRHLLVRCVDGRPTKVEPNKEHPAGGVTGTYAQAAMLELYDPDRARGETGVPIRREGKKRVPSDWDSFIKYGSALTRSSGTGERLAVLMSPTTSPTTLRMLAKLQEKLPAATICFHDSVTGGVMAEATQKVFGTEARQDFDFTDAKVIVSIQSDLLGTQAGAGDNARTFSKSRDPLTGEADPVVGKMSRLYVAEGSFTTTGVAADARIALRPTQMPALIAELGRRIEQAKSGSLAKAGMKLETVTEDDQAYNEVDPQDRLERFLDSAASDLAAAGDKGVVVVGDALGVDMIAAGIDLNSKLGSLGAIQKFTPVSSSALKNQVNLSQLTEKMLSGNVDSIFIVDTNAVYNSPADIDFAEALSRVEHSIYLGMYDDETAAKCEWSLPMAHPFESWGDCVGREGHYGVCQPQILPLLGGQTPAEVLAVMLGEAEYDIKKLVRRTADSITGSAISDRQWRKLLHDGYADDMVVAVDAVQQQETTVELPAASPVLEWDYDEESFHNRFEVIFTPADGLYDGRFANNGWLQEMPQSITKLTWDNAAIMSPRSARALGTKHGLMVALRTADGEVELPVFEVPGCAPGVVSVAIGYGRNRVGMVGGMADEDVPTVGVDVSPIRTTSSMLLATSLQARPRLTEYELCCTQDHWAIDELGRDETEDRSFMLIREGTTALLEKLPEFTEAKGPHVPKVGFDGSLWQEPINQIEKTEKLVPQWGMSVDLSKCLGCNDCVIACQSENNVPIVGKEQVGMSREMHWLRIDRYFQGDEDHADIVQEPVACMHCETAPCEQVCPVAATVHTDEGINAMAYNRCIGTRYCANNCPFKVRRFNYFNFNEDIGVGYGIDAYPGSIEEASRKLQALVLNPDVTVRGRGVMEKCTYCVQRVEGAKIDARKEGRTTVADGAIVTACQAACPTGAIEFGNVADPESRVSKAKADVRNYGMLGQLNVKPRTSYLSRIRNTPVALMTRAQLDDLTNLKAPHHGHEEHGHGEGGEHGHDSGEHAHDNGEHQARRNRARYTLPIV
ncbi:TAT-variant-translocated molybdopterin oxidoreductase [Allorhodopirellula heiligendammensis]|uniref:Tetrathionate reductase subunit B n=1 Tax=Allorhodopirellula heiligendammensis TaxID=2714739 RepID=A0A5C6BTA0_9BACT|nr:TAT-variant-translocated molybdopterin oxidoreductase [Allorhodopirellula heiligendammensis]TWU15440.1 Tetrathionate reductase subunit B precursor [Allorhodopirellula heiligendammensis]